MANAERPQIAILTLGGTIAGVRGETGVVPGLDAEAIAAAVPWIHDIARISSETVATVPSHSLSVDVLLGLAERIEHLAAAGGCEGIVVVQGMDTIEETSVLLDAVLDLDIPVVITGAMRHPLMPSPDGPANLLAAVTVAANPAVRRRASALGVVVVLNDTIHAAVEVVKGHTYRADAFLRSQTGPVGLVVEDRVVLMARPLYRHFQPLRELLAAGGIAKLRASRKNVALITAALDDCGELLMALIAAEDHLGCSGLVVAAMGGGHVPVAMAEPLSALARLMPVVMAARAGSGPLLANTYGGPGSEVALRDSGIIATGRLHPLKAHVLVILALRAGADSTALRAILEPFDRMAEDAC